MDYPPRRMGTAEEIERSLPLSVTAGPTGLRSVAFYRPDHAEVKADPMTPSAQEEVGGVVQLTDTVADMERLCLGILDQISVHFTINATAAIILAM
ncbi:MAG: methylmalonyl-CoA mutase family protein [Anaerolineae bacterium]